MDVFDEELLKFWKSLEKHQVVYIMVGGVATNLNGYQRSTEDIDMWIEDTIENREKLRAAFLTCEMGNYSMISKMQFVPGWTYFHLNNGMRLDIMTSMMGLENYTIHECLELSFVAEIDGTKIPFLNINQLIENKKAVNRPKDQLDVIYLEKIKNLSKQNPG